MNKTALINWTQHGKHTSNSTGIQIIASSDMSTCTGMQSTVEKVGKPTKCTVIIQIYKLSVLCTLVVYHYHHDF